MRTRFHDDLAQVAAIEHHEQVVVDIDDDAAAGGMPSACAISSVSERMKSPSRIDFGLLAVAAVQLQHFADDAVDALRVVADHAEQPRAFGDDAAVFLEQLRTPG